MRRRLTSKQDKRHRRPFGRLAHRELDAIEVPPLSNPVIDGSLKRSFVDGRELNHLVLKRPGNGRRAWLQVQGTQGACATRTGRLLFLLEGHRHLTEGG